MFIQTEATPNPATIKFLPGQPVLKTGVAEFKNSKECVNSPLAERLFKLQGVEGVFLATDFISVTKAEDTDWVMLKPMVLGALMEHLSLGLPIVEEEEGVTVGEDDDEISAQIPGAY